MNNPVMTVEELESISQRNNIPFVDLLIQYGCHYVFKKIIKSSLRDKLWLKKKLNTEPTEPGLVFFPAKDNCDELKEELESLFQEKEKEGVYAALLKKENKELPFSMETKNRILLQIILEKYKIPFYIEIKPYKKNMIFPIEENAEGLPYYRFPVEEYLAQGFYEILDKLELLNELSWYKDIYDILLTEPIEGRKVRDCFVKLLEAKKIPSLEKRLNTVKGYVNYGYMKKKWKNEKKRQAGEFPEWSLVIDLLIAFFSPIFDAVMKDEIFFEDWMPQLGRYL